MNSLKSIPNLINFFRTNNQFLKSKSVLSKIQVPTNLSFYDRFSETLLFFERLCSSLYLHPRSITIDFSDCKLINIASATLMQIIITDFIEFQDEYNRKNFKKLKKKLIFIKSKNLNVIKTLHALNLFSIDKEDEKRLLGKKYIPLGLKVGLKLRKSYYENRKGAICKEFRNFINSCLKQSEIQLNENGENNLDSLISEILGNAEDHSQVIKWYVNGVSFIETPDSEPVIEVNFAILNFGYSFFEGFEITKNKNHMIYQKMMDLYSLHEKLMDGQIVKKFSKEALFTLYSLQEGVSRLKFEDESRGNGTMNFIRAFISLGAFGEKNPKYKARLNIVSGHTLLTCDSDHSPIKENSIYLLPLNKNRNIRELPSSEMLHNFNDYFPGTILQVKIFLNKTFFMDLLKKNNGSN
jgi:hypothetical protein